MDVRINQSRQQRPVAEVNDLSASWMLHRRTGLDDALTLHQDFAGLENPSALDVEQACGAEHDEVCAGLRLGNGGVHVKRN